MQDLFKMRRRKDAATRAKLLIANEHVCFPNDVEFRQSWIEFRRKGEHV